MRVILRFLLITLSPLVWAQTSFEKAVDKINEHELLNVDAEAVVAIENEATAAGSWGDPRLSLAAINYPKESLANDESMMTGIQVGIMQTVSLSGKYGKLNNSMLEKSQAAKADKLQTRRNLLKKLWELAITQEKLQAEKAILSENYKWLDNNLKVSKKLYTNGKIPQQAVLDIQIRKSELALQIAEKNYALDQLSYQLGYVLNQNEKKQLEISTIPWVVLDEWRKDKVSRDFQQKSLEHKLRASDLAVSAQNRDLFPDLTFGLTYTKRNDIDGLGDFVGASVSFPIPTSSKKYASKKSAVATKAMSEAKLRHYKLNKTNTLARLNVQIEDLNNQLRVLNNEVLKFAQSSRNIVSRSYARGGTDYLELLRSELQYQNQRLKKTALSAAIKNQKLNYLYLNGGKLTPGEMK